MNKFFDKPSGIATPSFLKSARLEAYFEEIEADDALLKKEGVEGLPEEDVVEAAFDRGIFGLDRNVAEVRNDLHSWIQSENKTVLDNVRQILKRSL